MVLCRLVGRQYRQALSSAGVGKKAYFCKLDSISTTTPPTPQATSSFSFPTQKEPFVTCPPPRLSFPVPRSSFSPPKPLVSRFRIYGVLADADPVLRSTAKPKAEAVKPHEWTYPMDECGGGFYFTYPLDEVKKLKAEKGYSGRGACGICYNEIPRCEYYSCPLLSVCCNRAYHFQCLYGWCFLTSKCPQCEQKLRLLNPNCGGVVESKQISLAMIQWTDGDRLTPEEMEQMYQQKLHSFESLHNRCSY